VVGAPSREAMGQLLVDIRSGAFAKEFVDEMDSGSKNFNALREAARTQQIEQVGAELRAMMPWLKKR
ncbi:MAG TPA: ketol-acid reductoisomerase, partial [Actinomycetota bacterium]|nr:ketol-acid reductoisomerase [Actinomycetota bacterium]